MPFGVGAGDAVGGLSDLVGLFTGVAQQSQEGTAINQTGNQFQQGANELMGQGGQLYGNYTSNAQPELNTMIGQEPGQIAGYQNAASGLYGGEAGLGSTLAASQYPGLIQSEGGEFMTAPAGTISSELGNVNQLENWQGIGPKELGEASTVASNAAQSAAQTMKSQMGGVPNAGALAEQLGNQAAQAGLQASLGLGAQAEQQELGAKEAAGQELGSIAGQQLQQVAGQVGATEGAGQQYAGDIEGAGGLMQGAAGGEAGLAGQDIQQLLSALGTEAGMAQTGIGAEGQGTNDLLSLLQTEYGQIDSQGNPFTNFGQSLLNMFPMSSGGQVGGGVPASGLNSTYQPGGAGLAAILASL